MTGVFVGFVTLEGKLTIDRTDEFKAFVKQFTGDEVELEIRKRRSKRTLKQNAFFHAAISPLAEHLGCTTEELKIDLLGTWFGWKEIRGTTKVPNRMHTSELNTKEFADLMDHTMQIAAEEGIVILDPSEHHKGRKKRAA